MPLGKKFLIGGGSTFGALFIIGLIGNAFTPPAKPAAANKPTVLSAEAFATPATTITPTATPTVTVTPAPTILPTPTPTPKKVAVVVHTPVPTAPPVPASNCDPNYTPCVPIASDVDCAGGSGNGPAYVKGPVHVIGKDIYHLDSDGDGIGCE